ncbi:MAG TPA: VOC family protein [Verrucomicrobiae bacterium]|jgi:predicted 3-demethylubiquinone-9 3-methyltransferase (glyoxalase superfamily)|nr:VOC family protein [Verrucomicrobiae bacterium]
MQKITPFLWFNENAEEAAKFYVSIFKNSKILDITHYGKAGAEASGRHAGTVMTVKFLLEGQEFVAINGGPNFKFTEAISFVVNCETQAEVDQFWKTLSAGGEEGPCGWLKDKYGVSWQVVPTVVIDMISDKNAEKANRAMDAVMHMGKIDVKAVKEAYGR